MDSEDTIAFLREREEKLGAPIKFRTYCPWFASPGGERRDYGVFLYTDGRTMIYEDFDREPMILGIPIRRKHKEKYEKLEASFPVSSVVSVDRVTRAGAERSLELGRDITTAAGMLSIALRKLVTRIVLSDGTVLYMEIVDHRKFEKMIKEWKEGK